MKKVFFVFILALVTLFNGVLSYAKDKPYKGPDFTAKKVTVDGEDKTVSQIHMSRNGFREVLMTNVPYEIIYVSRFKDKKTWMVIPSKKLYSDMASLPGHDQSEFTLSTLFDNKPCQGFDKTKMLSTKTISKKKVEEWGCINTKSKQAILQWFEPESKMVIREKDKGNGMSDIMVSQVEFKSQPESLFTLPNGYKKVTMNEMIRIMSTH